MVTRLLGDTVAFRDTSSFVLNYAVHRFHGRPARGLIVGWMASKFSMRQTAASETRQGAKWYMWGLQNTEMSSDLFCRRCCYHAGFCSIDWELGPPTVTKERARIPRQWTSGKFMFPNVRRWKRAKKIVTVRRLCEQSGTYFSRFIGLLLLYTADQLGVIKTRFRETMKYIPFSVHPFHNS